MPFVFLDLITLPGHLKNLIACMRLMDVVGIVVGREYQKRVVKLVPRLDRGARKMDRVNVIVNRNGIFTGYYVKDVVQDTVSLLAKEGILS